MDKPTKSPKLLPHIKKGSQITSTVKHTPSKMKEYPAIKQSVLAADRMRIILDQQSNMEAGAAPFGVMGQCRQYFSCCIPFPPVVGTAHQH
jgi:hypothetical protein